MSTVPPIGTRLRDNDPRADGNIIVVTGYAYPAGSSGGVVTHVTYQSKSRRCRVRLDRIYADDKTRQVGYNIVP